MHIDFSISQRSMDKLIRVGACSVKALSERETSELISLASEMKFEQRLQLTSNGVTQNFLGSDEVEKNRSFWSVGYDTSNLLNKILSLPGSVPYRFNDFSLQLYPVSKPEDEYAISPHRDSKACINLIAVYLLRGNAPFYICEDRSGTNPVEIPSSPGDLILMRGTGFMGIESRPFHFVGPVTEERLTFGLRQTVDGRPMPKY